MRRKKPIRRSNPQRRAKRFKQAFGSPERVAAIQAMPCAVCGSRPSQCAHVRSRAAGGTYRDIVPLCHAHHAEQHQIGIASFEERHGLDLAQLAEQVASEIDLH